jgi:hypothetical protein
MVPTKRRWSLPRVSGPYRGAPTGTQQQRTSCQHHQALSRRLLCTSRLLPLLLLLLPLLLHGLASSRARQVLSLLRAAGALPLRALLQGAQQ